jgi:hypothetical protein
VPTPIRQPPRASPDHKSAIPRRALTLAVAIGSIGLLVAGCGSSSAPGPGPSPATFTAAAFRYARCVRDNGLPLFPDPSMTDHNGQQIAYLPTPSSLIASPAFKRANAVCQRILTPALDTTENVAARAARERQLTAFAKCMRGRGVPAFPDPDSQAQLSRQAIINAGVDLHAPAVVAAAKQCLPAAGGAITAGQIERAVSGAS